MSQPLCRCGRKKPRPAMLVCSPCWARTPIPLRSAVLRTRRTDSGGPTHIAAVRAVLNHLNLQES